MEKVLVFPKETACQSSQPAASLRGAFFALSANRSCELFCELFCEPFCESFLRTVLRTVLQTVLRTVLCGVSFGFVLPGFQNLREPFLGRLRCFFPPFEFFSSCANSDFLVRDAMAGSSPTSEKSMRRCSTLARSTLMRTLSPRL